MSYSLEEIEGIDADQSAKLSACGIKTTSALLKRCADPKGRRKISDESGISEERLLAWAHFVELMGVRGIGRQYAELLLGAGVHSIKELRARKPAQLAAKMAEVNAVKNLTRRIPVPVMIEEWIELAAKLKPVITY